MRLVDGDHTLFMRIDSIAVKQDRVCGSDCLSQTPDCVLGNQETLKRICQCYSFFFFPST